MPDLLTIPKTSSFPPYLDFSQLRAAGIRHIESLGSDLWTDYNVHDPGITILEAVCFALTDLGYRTNFEFKDLLTQSSQTKNGAAKTIFQLPLDNNFFTAAQVLTCNPVTINDFRKLLIDVPGVKNAWLQKAPEGELPLFLHRKRKALGLTQPFPDDEQLDRLSLRGLYDVCVELDDVLVTDACGRTFFSRNDILEKVYTAVHAHRNLCEDVREVLVLGDELIAVCADLELQPEADPEDVLLEMYKRIEEFLSPTLRFYTFQEMLAKGVPVEEIFAGRPLTATSHGFIDLEELKKIDLKADLHVSDIYQVIMDIPGVAAVRNLALTDYIDDVPFTRGEKWCLPLKPYYRPHFYLQKSQITFFKGVLPFNARMEEVKKRYNEEKAAKRKAYLDPYQLDLPIPEGTHRDIEAYTSIMEEFPLTYGVGQVGIKQLPTAMRQGQARQMKGYLLFFDQLLANYLTQLTHLRDLFSVQSEGSGGSQTYFTHILREVPGIEQLVKNYHECSANDGDDLAPEDYPSYLQHIAESLEKYQDRRNRFLDHLLARFSESFTDYVLLSYKLNGEKIDPAAIIQDKADFLKNYPEISRNRGKGMDYTRSDSWGSLNTSGLEKRVSKIIGLDDITRHTLAHTRLVETEAGWKASIQGADGKAVLVSKAVWPSATTACDAAEAWANLLGTEQYYRRLTFDVAGEFVHTVQILEKQPDLDTSTQKTVALALGLVEFASKGRYCEAVQEYIQKSHTFSYEIRQKDATEEVDRTWTFLVKDAEGTEVLRSAQTYPNTDAGKAARQAALERLKQLLASENAYCRQQVKVDHNNEYGFLLLDAAGAVIAESVTRYRTIAKRDGAIHDLVNFTNLTGLRCTDGREENCFYFELYDYLQETRLFVSQQGFQSELLARGFFDTVGTEDDFKGWAVQLDHYEMTEPDGRFSFRLKDSTGAVKAIHPHNYGTAQERDDRLQAIIYYLDVIPPTLKIEAEKVGDFQFDIVDVAGMVLLKSTRHYTTHLEAENAAWKTRIQARYRTYYKPNNAAPYSFTVLDRFGEEIAYHPEGYATECERDLVIDTLLYGSQNIDVRHRIEVQADGFHYVLLSPDGTVLVTGLIGYADASLAEVGWSEFLGWAEHKEHYHLTEEVGAEHPHGFDTWDDLGQAVASSVKQYATEAEAKMAARVIRNYVCHTEWSTVFTGEPGIYWFQLLGVQGRLLLRSAVSYPDEPSTKSAYQAALLLAGDKARYFDLPDKGFDLRDTEGNVVALHPQQYANDDEREAAKNLIVSDVRTDVPHIKTPNTGGAFYGTLYGADGAPAFVGTTIHPNAQMAQADVEQLLLLATDRDHYLRQDSGYTACQFSFSLIEGTGAVVARHPRTYATAAKRDEAMLAIFAWLTHGAALADDAVQGKPDFRFALQNEAGHRLLVSTQQFDTQQEARDGFAPFLEDARQYARFEKFTDGMTGQFGFFLKNSANATFAQHPPLYPAEVLREEAIWDIILLVALRGAQYRIFEENGSWKYALKNAGGDDMLLDSVGAPGRASAAEQLQRILPWAQQQERYLLVDENESCLFGFALTDPDHAEIASCPHQYASADLRDAALNAFIEHLTHLDIAPGVVEVPGTFYFQLTDFSGHILLQSKKSDYVTVAATQAAWMALLPAIDDPANFQVVYANGSCAYSVGILVDGEIIAGPPGPFKNRKEANEWIALLTDLLRQQPVATQVSGTTCGYYFVIEVADGSIGTKLLGTRRYPTPADAQHAGHEMAGLLRSGISFRAEKIGDFWYLLVYDAAGTVVAKSAEPPFKSAEEATAAYKVIFQKLAQPVSVSCQAVFQEQAYHCSLFEGDRTLLQHTPGKPFVRFGRSDRQWASHAVRDAMVEAAVVYFKATDIKDFELKFPPAAKGKVQYAVQLEHFSLVGELLYDSNEAAETAFGEQLAEWRLAANYQPVDDEASCHHSFEVIQATVKEAACQDCDQLLELAQLKTRFSFISNEEECLFGFELTDPDGIPIATSPTFFPTEVARDKAIRAIIERVNGEGMHLVEHLLLRPRKTANARYYTLGIKDKTGQVRLRHVGSFEQALWAEKAMYGLREAVLQVESPELLLRVVQESPTVPVSSGENQACWWIEVLDRAALPDGPAPKILARSVEGYCAEDSREEALQLVKYLLVSIAAVEESELVLFFADIQCLPWLYDDLETDDLLPLIGGCADPARQLSADLSDPYSFRATVVLPYWPARFQRSEFRSFLETTLRQQAPAHIFLRICWVNACQMREFETAFRRWLRSKALGEGSCDTSAALNALIDILFRLRNVYPAGTLHDCSEPDPNANQIVLNYSIIGSANSNSHGNQ